MWSLISIVFFVIASTTGKIKGMKKPLAYYRYHKNNLEKNKKD